MSTELLLNVASGEKRVAVVEDGLLQEIYIERSAGRGIVGNIYRGKVIRVLPGMQVAFVDIGTKKSAFLSADDVTFYKKHATRDTRSLEKISELLYEGQSIIVQVLKSPVGNKGARLTTNIVLLSRHLIFMPRSSGIFVSRRVADENERRRLKDIVRHSHDNIGRFIIRAAAEELDRRSLSRNVAFLENLWSKILEHSQSKNNKTLLHSELEVTQRLLRDLISTSLTSVLVDSKPYLDALKAFSSEYAPELTDKLWLHEEEEPIFDTPIENEIQRSLGRRVMLKSGGYLVIDQTEAVNVIDVNTGAFVGSSKNVQETILSTNIEASLSIARQIRLRNLGGIIIIDFINMKSDRHRRNVLRSLENALRKDRAKIRLNGFTRLGLVEMTRARTYESTDRILHSTCPTCGGRGRLKTVESVCRDIFRELALIKNKDTDLVLVHASLDVSKTLRTDESHALSDLAISIGKHIQIQAEKLYTREQFDVIVA